MTSKSLWWLAGAFALAVSGSASAQEIGDGAPEVKWEGEATLFGLSLDGDEDGAAAAGIPDVSDDPGAESMTEGPGDTEELHFSPGLSDGVDPEDMEGEGLGDGIAVEVASPSEGDSAGQIAVKDPNAAAQDADDAAPASAEPAAPDSQAVNVEGSGGVESDPRRLTTSIPVATPEAPASPNVSFASVVAPGAAVIPEGVSYRVWRKRSGRFFLAHEVGHDDDLALAPGTYRLEATYGRAVKVEDFEVQDATPFVHQVDLNAGWATLRLISHLNGKPLDGPIKWDVYTYARGKDGKRIKIDSNSKTQPAYVLSAGHYYVEARHGDATVNHVVEITAGHRYTYTLNLNAGTMRTFAEIAEGVDPMAPIVWEVYPVGQGQGIEPIATGQSQEADFVLNEGRYVVVASQGEAVTSKEISVRAGKASSLKLNLTQ